MKRAEAFSAISESEDMCSAVKAALHFHFRQIKSTPGLTEPGNQRVRDILRTLDELEATYLVRIFAVFESILRNYWLSGLGKRTYPRASTLIDAVASRRRVPAERIAEAHEVRRFRNYLVHASTQPEPKMTLAQARRRLCRFLAYLPLQW
jgi:hypothetical protein